MVRFLTCVLWACVLPGICVAHSGHLIEAAGHDHLLAGAAIGIAIVVGVAGILKGKDKDEEDASEETESQEAETA